MEQPTDKMASTNTSHTRSLSADAMPSHCYQLILEHILTLPAAYEIPLRTMYSINCTPSQRGSQSSVVSHGRPRDGSMDSHTSGSPTSASFPFHGDMATHSLTSNLAAQMANLPSQPNSLPPTFITSFVKKCFAADLRFVDFPQALTGLDYLKDLEMRRRRDVAATLERLDIKRETIGSAEDDLTLRFPNVVSWFRSLEEKERKIEALYTQLYVGLRRWILINELSLTPFNKHNSVAMLNTLYPPIVSSQPTSKLTPTILKKQRDSFFKYIQGVEKNGTALLTNLMQQGKRPTDENGWPCVRTTLDMYLQVANSLINECTLILDADVVADSADTKRKGRKVDSGISFTDSEERRPSSSSSKSSKNSFVDDALSHEARPKSSSGRARGSTFSKIAREFKNFGKMDVEEMIKPATPEPETVSMSDRSSKSLRKIRSFSSLGNMRSANSSVTCLSNHNSRADLPHFDADEMKRQRLIYESNAAKSKV